MPDGFIDEIVFVAVYPVRQVGRIIVPVDEIDRSGRNPPGELRVAGVDSRIQDGHDDAPAATPRPCGGRADASDRLLIRAIGRLERGSAKAIVLRP